MKNCETQKMSFAFSSPKNLEDRSGPSRPAQQAQLTQKMIGLGSKGRSQSQARPYTLGPSNLQVIQIQN